MVSFLYVFNFLPTLVALRLSISKKASVYIL